MSNVGAVVFWADYITAVGFFFSSRWLTQATVFVLFIQRSIVTCRLFLIKDYSTNVFSRLTQKHAALKTFPKFQINGSHKSKFITTWNAYCKVSISVLYLRTPTTLPNLKKPKLGCHPPCPPPPPTYPPPPHDMGFRSYCSALCCNFTYTWPQWFAPG